MEHSSVNTTIVKYTVIKPLWVADVENVQHISLAERQPEMGARA